MKDDYIKLRLQWENLTPDQEKLCSILRLIPLIPYPRVNNTVLDNNIRERRALIGKDIIRTEPGRLTDPEIERLNGKLFYSLYREDIHVCLFQYY